MAYFAGPLLKRKIEEYDLADLDQVLASVADGTGTWPAGGCIIPTPPVVMEATRIVLYSMLHSYGLKDAFVVKAHYNTFELSLDMRHKAGTTRRSGGLRIGSSPGSGHSVSLQDVPAVPEDLDKLWNEDITLETPVGAGARGSEAVTETEAEND